MTNEEQVLRQLESIVDQITTHDLTYRDSVTIGRSIDFDEWVAVATWGAADELQENDEPEPWPIRLRVHDTDGDESSAYLSLSEARQLVNALRRAIHRAERFPQPPAAGLSS